MVRSTKVSVLDNITPVLIAAANEDGGSTGYTATLRCMAVGAGIYIGGEDVNSINGFSISGGGDGISLFLDGESLYAISADGNPVDVNVLLTGV